MPLWLLSPVEKIPQKRTFVLKAHLRAIFREQGRQRGGMWMKRRRMGRMGREVKFILISISSSAVDHCHSYCQRLQLPGNVPSVPARSTVARGVEWSGSEGRWEDFPAAGFVENCCHWISKNHTTCVWGPVTHIGQQLSKTFEIPGAQCIAMVVTQDEDVCVPQFFYLHQLLVQQEVAKVQQTQSRRKWCYCKLLICSPSCWIFYTFLKNK